jgi:YHS domain-containing protein
MSVAKIIILPVKIAEAKRPESIVYLIKSCQGDNHFMSKILIAIAALVYAGTAAVAAPSQKMAPMHGHKMSAMTGHKMAPMHGHKMAPMAKKAAKPAAKAAKAEKLVCAVTGESIASVKDAAGSSTYKGKTYYFCCAGCKPQFDANPAKYVKSASAGEHHGMKM